MHLSVESWPDRGLVSYAGHEAHFLDTQHGVCTELTPVPEFTINSLPPQKIEARATEWVEVDEYCKAYLRILAREGIEPF